MKRLDLNLETEKGIIQARNMETEVYLTNLQLDVEEMLFQFLLMDLEDIEET